LKQNNSTPFFSKDLIKELIRPANVLSLLRIPLGILIIIFFDNKPLFLTLFVLGAITDLLDGYVARKTGLSSYGGVIDGFCDKVFFTSILIACLAASLLNVWQLLLLLPRDITVIMLGIFVMTLKGKKNILSKIKSSGPSKATTLGQFIVVIWLLSGIGQFTFILYIVSAVSFIAAMDYVLFVKKNL